MSRLSINKIYREINGLWDSFWFKPISAKPLSLFRIFFGLLLVQFGVLLLPDIFVWFGKYGILSSKAINTWQPAIRLNILNLFPENDTWLLIIFALFLIGACFITIGFITRPSTIMVFICLVSLHARNYLILNSGDILMRALTFWLIFSPAGKCLSIDSLLHQAKQKASRIDFCADTLAQPWAQRLMQINISMLYGQTFLKKIVGGYWQDGTAVYFSSHFVEMQRLPINFIFDHLWTIRLITYATLSIELALALLIWFKPIRYYVILLGVIMHLVIDWSMLVPQFEWLMICTFILFVDPPDLDRLFACFRRIPCLTKH